MNAQYLKQVINRLEKALNTNKAQRVAAFDADGTLWPSDVGREFFYYQAQKGLLKNKFKDLRAEFEHVRNTKGKKMALLWLAEIQAGHSLTELNTWIQDFLLDKNFELFAFQTKIIKWLIHKKVQVFIVSSSLQWTLEQVLKNSIISLDNIIGVKTQVEKGIITNQALRPSPVQEEKVEALLEKTKGVKPFFSVGNTLADKALLELSTHERMVIATAPPGAKNYDSERALLQEAQKNHWLFYDGL